MAINTYFKNIADAIREKTGGSAFITPGQMPGEIRSISTGGLSGATLLHKNIQNAYMNSNYYYISGGGEGSLIDIYQIEPKKRYIVFLGPTYSNKFKVYSFTQDPYSFTSNRAASSSYANMDTASAYRTIEFTSASNEPYLAIYKTNNGTIVPTYCVTYDELIDNLEY